MRTRFDEQLEQLHVKWITVEALCKEAITAVIQAFFEKDTEWDIEAFCMYLLL